MSKSQERLKIQSAKLRDTVGTESGCLAGGFGEHLRQCTLKLSGDAKLGMVRLVC